MPRESHADRAARIAADNAAAAAIPTGATTTSDLFGTLVLGENRGPDDDAPHGWDMYDVTHSGLTHRWSSVLIVGAFTAPDGK